LLWAQGNMTKQTDSQKHNASKERTPKDYQWGREETQLTQNSRQAKQEDCNVSKHPSSQLLRLLGHRKFLFLNNLY